MNVPSITTSRLQRVVADTEFNHEGLGFAAMCEAAVNHEYATKMELNGLQIGVLILQHNTVTLCDKPDQWPPADVEVLPEPVVVDPPSVEVVPQVNEKQKRVAKQIRDAMKVGPKLKQPEVKKVDPNEEKAELPIAEALAHQKGELLSSKRLLYICTPAGKCPVKLEGTELEDVEEWAVKVRAKGLENTRFYMVRALMYYVRDFYAIFSEEYPIVCDHLKTVFSDELRAA